MKFPRFLSGLALWKRMAGVFGPASGGWLAGWLGNEGERLAARFLRRQATRFWRGVIAPRWESSTSSHATGHASCSSRSRPAVPTAAGSLTRRSTGTNRRN